MLLVGTPVRVVSGGHAGRTGVVTANTDKRVTVKLEGDDKQHHFKETTLQVVGEGARLAVANPTKPHKPTDSKPPASLLLPLSPLSPLSPSSSPSSSSSSSSSSISASVVEQYVSEKEMRDMAVYKQRSAAFALHDGKDLYLGVTEAQYESAGVTPDVDHMLDVQITLYSANHIYHGAPREVVNLTKGAIAKSTFATINQARFLNPTDTSINRGIKNHGVQDALHNVTQGKDADLCRIFRDRIVASSAWVQSPIVGKYLTRSETSKYADMLVTSLQTHVPKATKEIRVALDKGGQTEHSEAYIRYLEQLVEKLGLSN